MSKKSKIWYGYLDAGTKSSPVLLDPKLDTGDSKTFYLFNHKRNQILEYRKDLIEPKLRELNGKESDLIDQIKKDYNKIRTNFTPRKTVGKVMAEAGATSNKPAKTNSPDIEDVVDDDIDLSDDIDLDSDE